VNTITINISVTQDRIEKPLGYSESTLSLVRHPHFDDDDCSTCVELMTESEQKAHKGYGPFAKIAVSHPAIILGDPNETIRAFKDVAWRELAKQGLVVEQENGLYILKIDSVKNNTLAKLMRFCPNVVADILYNRKDSDKVNAIIREFAGLYFGDYFCDAAMRGLYNPKCTIPELRALKEIHDKSLYSLYKLAKAFYPKQD
jgi:hypothetical protein